MKRLGAAYKSRAPKAAKAVLSCDDMLISESCHVCRAVQGVKMLAIPYPEPRPPKEPVLGPIPFLSISDDFEGDEARIIIVIIIMVIIIIIIIIIVVVAVVVVIIIIY
jgi:hypothetical protein